MTTAPSSGQTTAPPARDQDRTRLAARVLALSSGVIFLVFLDTTVVNVAFASMRRSFPGVTLAELTWVVTAYAVLFAAFLTSAGRLADVLGRKRVFIGAVVAFSLASFASAAAPDVGALIAARGVQGLAAASMVPSALGLLLAYTPAARRPAALGVWAGAGGVSCAIAPGLGGLLVSAWDWRGIFLINVPLGLLIGYSARDLPAERPTGRQLPDPAGVALLALGIGGLTAGLTQASAWGWASGRILALLATGLSLTAAALWRSKRHPAPAIEWELWRSRVFAASNACSLLFGAAMYAWLLSCPLFLVTVWHYPVLESGLGITPGAITSAAGAITVGRRIHPDRQWAAAVAGALCTGVSCLWMWAVIGGHAAYAADWLPAGLIGGAGLGVATTAMASVAARSLPPQQLASGNGLLFTSRQIGGAIGVAVLATILASSGAANLRGYLTAFGFSGVLFLATAVAAIRMRPARPRG